MKTFDVYKHPDNRYQAVKMGFGWPAFCFTWLWAFVKKMWVEGLVLLAVAVTISALDRVLELNKTFSGVILSLLLSLIFCFFVGLKGNHWRRNNLVKRGFEKMDTVEARTRDAAIAMVVKSKAEPLSTDPTQAHSAENQDIK